MTTTTNASPETTERVVIDSGGVLVTRYGPALSGDYVLSVADGAKLSPAVLALFVGYRLDSWDADDCDRTYTLWVRDTGV